MRILALDLSTNWADPSVNECSPCPPWQKTIVEIMKIGSLLVILEKPNPGR